MSDSILELVNISKGFGGTEVLRGIDLQVAKGEFVTMLGPSGCGKTTTLRIISGLESPETGSVILAGREVTNEAPNHRDVHTIFQNYALFPHMNVYQNITYSLRLLKVNKAEQKERAKRMLELVQLEGYEKRMPQELSGGQRQRVAIARGLISNPSVLLLDEPLGALDLQLRRQMQSELRRMQKSLGTTFIYITHDQEEAINMSDRIAVMNEGRIVQIGSPTEIYDSPRTAFVAGFIGTANILKGTVREINGGIAAVTLQGGQEALIMDNGLLKAGGGCQFSVRAENVRVSTAPAEGFTLLGNVLEHSYAGGVLRFILDIGADTPVVSSRGGGKSCSDKAYVSWKPEDAVPLEVDAH